MGELSPAALAQDVLTLPAFRAIAKEDFRQLLYYLIEIEHIQQTETGGLILGLMGEQIVRKFHFYTVFTNNVEYVVGMNLQKLAASSCLHLREIDLL
jgi:ATP-dependent Lhr-like helicase